MKRATGLQVLPPGRPSRYHVLATLDRPLSHAEAAALPDSWVKHPQDPATIVGVELETAPGAACELVTEALRAASPEQPPVWLNVQAHRVQE